MPLALIVGAFGQGNPGDEALLDAGIALVRGVPGWEPIVATIDPDTTEARHAVRAVPPTAGSVARQAAVADALVVPGGTVFKELHPSTDRPAFSLLRRGVALARVVKSRGRPVVLAGVGASAVRERAEPLVRALASCADLLVLRDDASARLLAEAGVPAPLRVGADLAWHVIDDAAVEPCQRSGEEIAVALSHLAGGPDLAALLAARLAPIVAAGHSLVLEPWQGPGRLGPDARIAHEIARRLGDRVRVEPPPAHLTEAVARARRRRAVVALRFHAAVAAAAAGTPFVAVAHEPKLAALAARVRQPALTLDAPPHELAAALRTAITGPGPDERAVAQERRRATATVDLAQLVLAGDGDPVGLEHLALVPAPVPA